MFVETGCDFALWGPPVEPPPTTNGAQDVHQLEDVLPISASLRDRLLAWGRKYEMFDLNGEEHDKRGYDLSRELKLELGDLYSVTTASPSPGHIERRSVPGQGPSRCRGGPCGTDSRRSPLRCSKDRIVRD